MQIWVDADACPKAIKDILYRAAERTGVTTILVANQFLQGFLEYMSIGGVAAATITEQSLNGASRPHDQTVTELLREDPGFADEYLTTAFDEINEPGGREALLAALRHVAEAQGMATIAERAGIKRESLYRALSPKGNPTIKTLLAVTSAAGLK